MLGLFLIYFIWKQFADLATRNGKNRMGVGVLGVIAYYAGAFSAGIFIGLFAEDFLAVNSGNNLALGLMAIPFGLCFSVALYFILKKVWSRNVSDIYRDIEQIGALPDPVHTTGADAAPGSHP